MSPPDDRVADGRPIAITGWLVEDRDQQRRVMTLGQATELLHALPMACACAGPGGCCVARYAVARELRQAAHIVAKLMVEVERG